MNASALALLRSKIAAEDAESAHRIAADVARRRLAMNATVLSFSAPAPTPAVAAPVPVLASPSRKPARYVDAAETAALVRQALKEAFPRTRFSVRSRRFAGGSSVDVAWTDGPAVAQVEAVVDRFEGRRFDGATDYAYTVDTVLDGEPVCFGSWVGTSRRLSDALIERVTAPSADDYRQGRLDHRTPDGIDFTAERTETWEWLIMDGARRLSTEVAQDSPTARRVG